MSVRAVLFDVDGVLLDSFDANCDFLNRLFQAAGYDGITIDEYRSLTHLPVNDLVQARLGCSGQEILRINNIAAHLPRSLHLLRMPEGEIEILQQLSQKYLLGIATSRTEKGLDAYFTVAGTRDLFSTAVHYGMYETPKPHPDPLLAAARLLGRPTKEMVYVGDTHVDIAAARACGMPVIQYTAYAPALQSADFVTSSFYELPVLIAKL